MDLTQWEETYYFRDVTPEGSLAPTIGYAAELAEAGRRSSREDVLIGGGRPSAHPGGLGAGAGRSVPGRETTDAYAYAYADDHGDTPRGRG